MRWLMLALTVFAFGFSTTAANADGPRGIGHVAQQPRAPMPMPPYSKQAQIGAYGRAVYPKYYRAFHFREFENVGIPHGDIGTVGNGLTRSPW